MMDTTAQVHRPTLRQISASADGCPDTLPPPPPPSLTPQTLSMVSAELKNDRTHTCPIVTRAGATALGAGDCSSGDVPRAIVGTAWRP